MDEENYNKNQQNSNQILDTVRHMEKNASGAFRTQKIDHEYI